MIFLRILSLLLLLPVSSISNVDMNALLCFSTNNFIEPKKGLWERPIKSSVYSLNYLIPGIYNVSSFDMRSFNVLYEDYLPKKIFSPANNGCALLKNKTIECWHCIKNCVKKIIPKINNALFLDKDCAILENGYVSCWLPSLRDDRIYATYDKLPGEVKSFNYPFILLKDGRMYYLEKKGQELLHLYQLENIQNAEMLSEKCALLKNKKIACTGDSISKDSFKTIDHIDDVLFLSFPWIILEDGNIFYLKYAEEKHEYQPIHLHQLDNITSLIPIKFPHMRRSISDQLGEVDSLVSMKSSEQKDSISEQFDDTASLVSMKSLEEKSISYGTNFRAIAVTKNGEAVLLYSVDDHPTFFEINDLTEEMSQLVSLSYMRLDGNIFFALLKDGSLRYFYFLDNILKIKNSGIDHVMSMESFIPVHNKVDLCYVVKEPFSVTVERKTDQKFHVALTNYFLPLQSFRLRFPKEQYNTVIPNRYHRSSNFPYKASRFFYFYPRNFSFYTSSYQPLLEKKEITLSFLLNDFDVIDIPIQIPKLKDGE